MIHVLDEFETGALDLDHQEQNGLQTSTVLEQIKPFFATSSNFANAKKTPTRVAHLWGAYAIPVALYGVCRTSCVVCVQNSFFSKTTPKILRYYIQIVL